ncbi:MAG TPA: hypothetical protein VLB44_25160 [Kofleriaceae bacterium]|nr:hypothetical protein [Kofleriaceae bacterium]
MSSEIFRDRSEGASARRQDLLRRRRDEFVMMPHAIRRVYVARRARSAASMAVWLTGIVLVTAALVPKLAAFMTRGMPGINPALLSTLVIAMWVIGTIAYFVARARCEHHFAVAISKTVLPGENVDDDVERLTHEHPDDVARGMAHKLEVRSAAWPVAAAALLLPATIIYLVQGVKAGGWPSIANYESSIAAHGAHLAIVGAVGMIAGVLVMRRSMRLPIVAPVVGGMTLVAGGFATIMMSWMAAFAVIGVAIAYIAFRLRRERTALETEDPAAGSEIFTWRDVVYMARSSVRSVTSKINTRQRKIVVGIVAATAVFTFATRGTHAPAAKTAHVAEAPTIAPKQLVTTDSGSQFKVSPTGDGAFKVEVTLVDDKGIDVTFPGVAMVPHGWTARLELQQLGPQLMDSLTARIGVSTQAEAISATAATSFSMSGCDEAPVPLMIHVGGPAGSYSLRITPVLEPAGC